MDIDVKGFGRVVGLSDERLRYYKRIIAFFNKYATFHFEAYASTDDVTDPKSNVIYLVGPKGNLDDKYEEYIYDDTKQDPWIKIGDTSIDLSQYVTVAKLIEELSKYTTTEDLTELLSRKQNTEEGKGLSTNDFTNALKGKLDGIQSGAQKNVNADWNSDSGDSQILNRPDLSGFITKTVNDLTNYYLKSEVYTKDQVAALIATINQFHYEVYPTLNEIVSPQNNVLYLIGPTGTGSDKYEEYIYPSVETNWVKIGDTSIDLRNYVTIDTLNTALATKQNTINDLDNIRSGAAAGATALQSIDENLTEQEFVYRVCPSTINPKSIILDKIKGKTLVWNQIVPSFTGSYFYLGSANGTISEWTATAQNGGLYSNTTIKVPVGHKVFVSLKIQKTNAADDVRLTWGQYIYSQNTVAKQTLSAINIIGSSGNIAELNLRNFSASDWGSVKVSDVMFIDLTLMFGAGNEPATVEEFKSMFPGYHDYNDGKLISNDAKEIETIGFNQWDEEWEQGIINSQTGENEYSITNSRSKNYISVIEGQTYYFKTAYSLYIRLYNKNKEYLGQGDTVGNTEYLIPAGVAFIRFVTDYAYITIGNICINISDPSKNGTYEPYKKSKINLNLNSFKVKDSQGNIVTINGGLKSAGSVYDEIVGNKYIKRITRVCLGDYTFTKVSDKQNLFETTTIADIRHEANINLVCNKYESVLAMEAWVESKDKVISNRKGVSSTPGLLIEDKSYNDVSTFNTSLSNVYLDYELATPIEYELIEPIVLIGKAGITEARISPNTDGLSAPFCGDITYTLADIYVPELKSINYITKITEITWSELKSLRDGGNLTPGMQYRITDYQCTTTQVSTQSANHQFDIIVIADDVNKLNENARACLHKDDSYFVNSKLESWKLKYCLDNDATRFDWVDQQIGKGVIYWMKDEYDNECPYDFKNIQFKRWAITDIINSNMESVALNSLKSKLLYASGHEYCFSFKSSNITINGATIVVNSNNYKWYYTFGETDGSLLKGVRDNKISYFSDTTIIKSLPNIVFINTSTNVIGCYKNILNNCNNSTFDYKFVNNIVNDSYNNIISYNYMFNKMYNSNDNIINRDCSNNIFDTINNNFISDNCQNNIVKNFRLNNIGYSFQFNICENNFYSNNIENTCSSNIFKTGFSNSTIKSSCSYNVFGVSCRYINLKSYCQYNIFGNDCSNINLESNCKYNIFENYCRYIYMGKSYMECIIVESGNMNITITSTQTTSGANTLQNFKIAQGVNNSGVLKTISHDTVNDAFQTIYKPVGSIEVEV